MAIYFGSRYESATVQKVPGRPVATPFTKLDEVVYLRGRRRQHDRVPVPGDKLLTRQMAPTVFPVKRPATVTASSPQVIYRAYMVVMGDTLQALAYRYFGDPSKWSLIADANPDVLDPDDLPVGTILKIPTGTATRRTSKPASNAPPRVLSRPFSGLR